MAKKKRIGGKRQGSGRKTLVAREKKERVTLWVKGGVIEDMGIDALKESCYEHLEKVYANKNTV